MSAGSGGRDLSPYLSSNGHIKVDVQIGQAGFKRETGAFADPATVAIFLRALADDVEHAGKDSS